MLRLLLALFAAAFIGCQSAAPDTPPTDSPTAPAPDSSWEKLDYQTFQQLDQTAGRFYDWLKSENFDAVKAMLDPASVPDTLWSAALIADLRDKQSKLGLPTGTMELQKIEDLSDPQRTIYALSYVVSYSKGFRILEKIYLLRKEGRFRLLDYSYDTTAR